MIRGPLSQLVSALACCCLALLMLAGPADADAISPPEHGAIVEQLRVKVPADARDAWLTAEQQTWGAWLQHQEGFLGRELLWDGQRQEGLLLIRWRSRRQWLAIPEREIDAVQRRFEASARRALAMDASAEAVPSITNPFPLVSAGELEWVGLTPAGDSEAGR